MNNKLEVALNQIQRLQPNSWICYLTHLPGESEDEKALNMKVRAKVQSE